MEALEVGFLIFVHKLIGTMQRRANITTVVHHVSADGEDHIVVFFGNFSKLFDFAVHAIFGGSEHDDRDLFTARSINRFGVEYLLQRRGCVFQKLVSNSMPLNIVYFLQTVQISKNTPTMVAILRIYVHIQYDLYNDSYFSKEGARMTMLEGKGAWTAIVGSKGQIVIPKEAREMFGIHPGDTLVILGDEKRGLAIPPKEQFDEWITIAFDGGKR